MARKPKEPLTPQQITAQNRADALRKDFDRTQAVVVPEPTRHFIVGEPVILGNRNNVVIDEIFDNGKAYLCKMDAAWDRSEKPIADVYDYMIRWWFDIEKIDARSSTTKSVFDPYFAAHITKNDLEGIFHHMNAGGLVCDPEFQRDYVWSDADREALLDSVCERLEIGSITFVRHHGYRHEGSDEVRTYRTLDGRTITIPAREDYTVSIVDGQQRLTTLYNFYTNRITYRGLYFTDLSFRDQCEFLQTQISFRIFEEESVTRKQILKIFLQCNRGVPQTKEHIAKVQALYDAEK